MISPHYSCAHVFFIPSKALFRCLLSKLLHLFKFLTAFPKVISLDVCLLSVFLQDLAVFKLFPCGQSSVVNPGFSMAPVQTRWVEMLPFFGLMSSDELE